MDGANMNAQVGLCQPGADRRRRLPHQPAQDLLHPARRRRAGHGADRASPRTSRRSCPRSATGGPAFQAAPSGQRAHPADLVDVHPHDGRRRHPPATEVAILNANYIARAARALLPGALHRRARRVAHECILDLRKLKETCGVTAEDVAKRLMDYGFHAPTLSFPVADTLMVEPTESESKDELDRFCDAMIAIHGELEKIRAGRWDRADNPLKNAPHTALELAGDWQHAYSREEAAFPGALAARREVLAAGEARRQRRRRPQPRLHLSADGGVCRPEAPFFTRCMPSSERASRPFAGYEMPLQYREGLRAEHLHTRAHAGLFDVSHMGQVRVTGPDLHSALERALPAGLSTAGRRRAALLASPERARRHRGRPHGHAPSRGGANRRQRRRPRERPRPIARRCARGFRSSFSTAR